MPCRQRRHWPQPAWISTVMRSPIANSSTPGPSATIVPMYSWPGVKFLLNGSPPSISAGGPLAITSRSVAQIATASMRTRTSARPGTGTGFSRRVSSPGSPSTHACITAGIGWSSLVTTSLCNATAPPATGSGAPHYEIPAGRWQARTRRVPAPAAARRAGSRAACDVRPGTKRFCASREKSTH